MHYEEQVNAERMRKKEEGLRYEEQVSAERRRKKEEGLRSRTILD